MADHRPLTCLLIPLGIQEAPDPGEKPLVHAGSALRGGGQLPSVAGLSTRQCPICDGDQATQHVQDSESSAFTKPRVTFVSTPKAEEDLGDVNDLAQ